MSAAPAPVRFADAVIRLDSMPVSGREVDVAPTAEERAALADQLGVTSVDRLSVKLHAVKFRGGIRVTGRLTASVKQPSVVTLEPVVVAAHGLSVLGASVRLAPPPARDDLGPRTLPVY